MESNKQAYLRCNVAGEFLPSLIIEFDSVYMGYGFGDCVVNKEQLKQISDNSYLVKLIGGVGKNDGRHPTSKDKEYVYVKMNSILDGGWAHFLVPKENLIYLED